MLKDYEVDDDDNKPDELQNDVLLIDFYDGAQLFQWKTCESWCFLTSIVNLPPAYRGMLVKRGLKIVR